MAGPRDSSRLAAACLTGVGLPDFIAPDVAGYIDVAIAKARDPGALAEPCARPCAGASPPPTSAIPRNTSARSRRAIEGCGKNGATGRVGTQATNTLIYARRLLQCMSS